MKEEIKNKLFDTTWKKSIWIFIIVFSLIVIGGIFSIDYIADTIADKHIHSENIVVADKFYGDTTLGDCYLIVDNNNKTYTIINHEDGYGQKMFDSIQVNKKYHVVTREPEITDLNQFTHIL